VNSRATASSMPDLTSPLAGPVEPARGDAPRLGPQAMGSRVAAHCCSKSATVRSCNQVNGSCVVDSRVQVASPAPNIQCSAHTWVPKLSAVQ
jgi:hypothetical protein